ncbi:MAG: O-antigen ligase family protein [Alphaproteobacteria bacterium]
MPFFLIAGRAVADIGAAVIIIGFLGHCLITKDWRFLHKPWFIIGTILWAWLVLILGWQELARQNMASHLGFMRFLLLAAALECWLGQQKLFNRWLPWSLGIAIIFTLICVWHQRITGYNIRGLEIEPGTGRLHGPFADLLAGSYLAKNAWLWLLPMGWWLHQQSARFFSAFIWFFLLTIITLTIFITGERVAMVTYMAGIGLSFIFFHNWRKFFVIAAIFLSLSGAGLLVMKDDLRSRLYRVNSEQTSHFSDSIYSKIWQQAAQIVKNQPLIGEGIAAMRHHCIAMPPEKIVQGPVQPFCALHAHQPLFEWATTGGIIALSLFMILIFMIIHPICPQLWHGNPATPFLWAGILSILSFLPPLLPVMSTLNNWNGIYLWWVMGVILAKATPMASLPLLQKATPDACPIETTKENQHPCKEVENIQSRSPQ